MTQATKHTLEELPTLRLPELQAYYAEVLGETTRCPNKKFLVRRITETLAKQTERQAAMADEHTQPESIAANDTGKLEPTAEPDATAEPAPEETAAPTETEELAESELAAAPAPDVEPAASELAAEPRAATEPELAAASSASDTSAAASATGDKPLTKLTVEELQQRYQDVVGRSTGSSNRRYLIWKIRQAENGKVPVGPRTRRSPDDPAPEFKVLPLRMEAEMVECLDEARQRLGLKNRMQLFRDALKTYFAAQGESEVAALFSR